MKIFSDRDFIFFNIHNFNHILYAEIRNGVNESKHSKIKELEREIINIKIKIGKSLK